MKNDNINNTMIKFLMRNFPVSRVKKGGRFRRAIVITSDEIYFLSNKINYEQLAYRLFDILLTVFCVEEEEMKDVVANHLNMK